METGHGGGLEQNLIHFRSFDRMLLVSYETMPKASAEVSQKCLGSHK